MTTETTNIDDLLNGAMTSSTQPQTPEYQPEIEDDSNYEVEDVAPQLTEPEQSEPEESIQEQPAKETDEYGNEKEKPRVYTEDEVNDRINKAIRDRLARMKSQEQPLPTQNQVQQAKDNFNYDPDSSDNWQQQLEAFVEQTFNKINQRQVSQAQQHKERQAQLEFEEKFVNGMERFQDFRDVVGAQNITDPMTYALRGVKDPAGFVYAASKRHPQELQRISQINDPYAQIVEMGKLEERMRKQSTGTNAPRPVSRLSEDVGMSQSKKKDEGDSIESLIAKSEAKKIAKLKVIRGQR